MKASLRNTTHSHASSILYAAILSWTSKLFLQIILQILISAFQLFFLFLSGRITLKVIFYYLHHFIFKVYTCSSRYFEKPAGSFVHRYRHVAASLRLKQWCINNEAVSLIHLHYAKIKRNPE